MFSSYIAGKPREAVKGFNARAIVFKDRIFLRFFIHPPFMLYSCILDYLFKCIMNGEEA
jgi:hypothetical protein